MRGRVDKRPVSVTLSRREADDAEQVGCVAESGIIRDCDDVAVFLEELQTQHALSYLKKRCGVVFCRRNKVCGGSDSCLRVRNCSPIKFSRIALTT